MKHLKSLFVILAAVLCGSANAQSVDTVAVWSASMKKNIKNVVITPAAYQTDKDARFPVVYLLHGAGGDFSNWIKKAPFLPATQLEGSWDIVQVGDEVLSPGQENSPFITFDLAQGRIWGNSGCNRMMGTFQTDSLQPGSLTFGAVATTRMACPNMEIENNILKALEAVRSFESVATDETDSLLAIALCDQKGKELLLLQQRPEIASAADSTALEGAWAIRTVNGASLGETEKTPILQFTLAEHRVYGNAGCNVINGTFELDPQNPSALTFGPMITTMMACQNMDAETAVLQALAQVQSFRVAGEMLYLCDASGSELLSLEKDPSLAE